MPASQLPNLGPTTITDSATNSRVPVRKAKPTAKGRVFQNGRSSLTSYAMFSASIVAAKAPDAAQSVPRIPRERNIPLLGETTSAKTLQTSPISSAGRKRASKLKAWLNRSGTGKYAPAADKKIRAGNRDRTK